MRHAKGPLGKLLSLLLFLTVIYCPIQVLLGNPVNLPAFAGVLMVLFWLHFYINGAWRNPAQCWFVGGLSLFLLCVIVWQSEDLLKFYPVIMNASVAFLFLSSLTQKTTLIELFAALSKTPPPSEAQPYLRKLTLAWGLLLLINASISLYTVLFSSTDFWALYNGILSYVFIGTFIVLELLFRHFYRKTVLKS